MDLLQKLHQFYIRSVYVHAATSSSPMPRVDFDFESVLCRIPASLQPRTRKWCHPTIFGHVPSSSVDYELLLMSRFLFGHCQIDGRHDPDDKAITALVPTHVRGPSPRNRSVAAPVIGNAALEQSTCPLKNFIYIGGSCFHMVPL